MSARGHFQTSSRVPAKSVDPSTAGMRRLRRQVRLPLVRPPQYDLKLSKKPGLRLDIDAAAVLFDDDVVAHRQAKPGTFTRGLGREERVEYFVFDLVRDAGAVIANTDLALVSEILGRSA